jgi:hypothetical protein
MGFCKEEKNNKKDATYYNPSHITRLKVSCYATNTHKSLSSPMISFSRRPISFLWQNHILPKETGRQHALLSAITINDYRTQAWARMMIERSFKSGKQKGFLEEMSCHGLSFVLDGLSFCERGRQIMSYVYRWYAWDAQKFRVKRTHILIFSLRGHSHKLVFQGSPGKETTVSSCGSSFLSETYATTREDRELEVHLDCNFFQEKDHNI